MRSRRRGGVITTSICMPCRVSVRADPESGILARPLACPKAPDCKGKDFIEQPAERILTDYQVLQKKCLPCADKSVMLRRARRHD
jgi:hypothetical protein